MTSEVFVFGSNLEGIHGAGAAKHAYDTEGAIWGRSEGHIGNSYAIPTKGKLSPLTRRFERLPLVKIASHVAVFKMYARSRPDLTFNVTKIGCGRAGYSYNSIAPFFKGSPTNVKLPSEFLEVLKGS